MSTPPDDSKKCMYYYDEDNSSENNKAEDIQNNVPVSSYNIRLVENNTIHKSNIGPEFLALEFVQSGQQS